jgi:hypothetical protein
MMRFSILLLVAACASESTPPVDPGDMGPGPDSGTTFTGSACPTDTGLSPVDPLPNTKARVVGDSVRITFDPRDARDYRVYEMPAAGDITPQGNRNAIYRCAGQYQVPRAIVESSPLPQSYAVRTRIASEVHGFARTEADATLGYVYTTPGDGRVPVYALGDPAHDADNNCYFQVWPESRVKKYTTDAAERDALLAERWRDDGIAFYVPAAPAANTRTVYHGVVSNASLYLVDGPERSERSSRNDESVPAFSVLASAEPGTEPLKRVYYDMSCSRSHDVLVATEARFQKAYRQGEQPIAELHWSGLSRDATLVVEALDAPCPFEGVVSPTARPAQTRDNVTYPPFSTLDDLRAASPLGEVYINGSGPAGTTPTPIARSCIAVERGAIAEREWQYDGAPETYTAPANVALATYHFESANFDIELYGQTQDQWSVGSILGELWTLHADVAADVSGLLRMMPKQRATISSDQFLHVTMQVDTISTSRRYPQMIISDQGWPITQTLKDGHSIIVQPFGGDAGATQVQIQYCDRRDWAVNAQCPLWDLEMLGEGDDRFFSPHVQFNGLQGVDRTVRFDVYASTRRVYVFTNSEPYGCVDLPDGFPAGPASVTFGDALYHSGVDLGVSDGTYQGWYPHLLEHMYVFTSRHWSNLAFTSNGLAPTWDHARMPCVPASGLH